jgi:hypothetical protein
VLFVQENVKGCSRELSTADTSSKDGSPSMLLDIASAVTAVKKCSAAAVDQVAESFKGLLYAVLLSAQDAAIESSSST